MSKHEKKGQTTLSIIKSQIKNFLAYYPTKTRALANVFFYTCNILQRDSNYGGHIPVLLQAMNESFKPTDKKDYKKQVLHKKSFDELRNAILILTFPDIRQAEVEEIRKYFYELGLESSLEGFLRREYNLGYEKNSIKEHPLSTLVSIKSAVKSVEHFSLVGKFDVATMQEKLHQYYESKNLIIEFPTTKFSGPLSYFIKNTNGNKIGYVHVKQYGTVISFIVSD